MAAAKPSGRKPPRRSCTTGRGPARSAAHDHLDAGDVVGGQREQPASGPPSRAAVASAEAAGRRAGARRAAARPVEPEVATSTPHRPRTPDPGRRRVGGRRDVVVPTTAGSGAPAASGSTAGPPSSASASGRGQGVSTAPGEPSSRMIRTPPSCARSPTRAVAPSTAEGVPASARWGRFPLSAAARCAGEAPRVSLALRGCGAARYVARTRHEPTVARVHETPTRQPDARCQPARPATRPRLVGSSLRTGRAARGPQSLPGRLLARRVAASAVLRRRPLGPAASGSAIVDAHPAPPTPPQRPDPTMTPTVTPVATPTAVRPTPTLRRATVVPLPARRVAPRSPRCSRGPLR